MKERQRWQPEEDALLHAYVKQYGAKEWNLISQRMGKNLDRDTKSCLERWKNYLKPGIKRGPLTPEEQTLVISLQSKYGNKWKKIAAEVPGRTAKRLGKWWEVFKDKQLKQFHKSQQREDYTDTPALSAGGLPEKAIQGKYDHILETFAEKYVQPKLFVFQSLPLPNVVPNLSLPDPPTVLSLGSVTITEPANTATLSSPAFPAWMNSTNIGSATTSSLTSSSSTPSPSVSLTISPPEPAILEPVQQEMVLHNRFFPGQQMDTLIQYCKELEESKQNWLNHKKEATWRLSRLEQQLESEKARKRREKMEEIEAKIMRLGEEEMVFHGKLEVEYRDQLNALQRDGENKEAKLMETWSNKHVKLTKMVEQVGIHSYGFTVMPNALN